MKTVANKQRKQTIEEQIVARALKNGAAFAADTTGAEFSAPYVVQGVSLAVERAIKLDLLTGEEKEATKYVADLRREEEQKRREALDREEAALKAELANLEATDAEN